MYKSNVQINKKESNFAQIFTLSKKPKILLLNLYSQKVSNDAPHLCITQFKFVEDGAHFGTLKIQ